MVRSDGRLGDRARDRLPRPEPATAVLVLLGRLRQVAPQRPQHLLPGPQRRRAVVLRAPTEQHRRPAFAGDPGQLAGQPALADARLPDQRGQRDRARLRLVEGTDAGRPAARTARPAATAAASGRTTGCGPSPRWRGRLGLAVGGARGRPGGRCREGARRLPVQRGVLAQHGRLQVAQLLPRLEAELLGEHVAHLAQGVEGLGLPAGPGQGQGPQPPQPFAQRVCRGERLELAGDRRVLPELEGRDRAVLEGDDPQLLQPGPLGHRERRVLELEVGRAAPEGERLVQLGDDRGELLGGEPARVVQAGQLADPAVRPADGPVEPRPRRGRPPPPAARTPGRPSPGPSTARGPLGPARGSGAARRCTPAGCRSPRVARRRPRACRRGRPPRRGDRGSWPGQRRGHAACASRGRRARRPGGPARRRGHPLSPARGYAAEPAVPLGLSGEITGDAAAHRRTDRYAAWCPRGIPVPLVPVRTV